MSSSVGICNCRWCRRCCCCPRHLQLQVLSIAVLVRRHLHLSQNLQLQVLLPRRPCLLAPAAAGVVAITILILSTSSCRCCRPHCCRPRHLQLQMVLPLLSSSVDTCSCKWCCHVAALVCSCMARLLFSLT